MLNSLKSPVNTIFVMLGQNCNFNCKYCMQHTENGLHVDLPQEINPDIYEFIEHHAEMRDKEKDGRLWIHFYGGEPLLYFDNIKKIVEKTKDLYVNYSFISNGNLITQEMVDFFNQYDFGETISWDGRASIHTRRIDVFANPEKKKLLFQLNGLGVSAVHSSFTTPIQILEDFQRLSDEYQEIHDYPMHINIDELFDTGVSDRDLFDIDYVKVIQDMSLLLTEYDYHIKQKDLKKYSTKQDYIGKLINRIDCNIDTRKRAICTCGNGYSVINMSLDGTLYSCHNCSDKLGTIYDSPQFILTNLFKYDKTMQFEEKCKDCPVQSICHNGCKLMTEKVRDESYCKLKKAVFLPVIQYVLSYSKKEEE